MVLLALLSQLFCSRNFASNSFLCNSYVLKIPISQVQLSIPASFSSIFVLFSLKQQLQVKFQQNKLKKRRWEPVFSLCRKMYQLVFSLLSILSIMHQSVFSLFSMCNILYQPDINLISMFSIFIALASTNIIEIEGLLFPGFGKCRRSMENWFFPSSDDVRALKNGALQLKNFERTRDVT